jgi:hypothetical protein
MSTASEHFLEQLRYAAYGTPKVHSQDLPAVREWHKILDEVGQRMWKEAFDAGVLEEQRQATLWHFPMQEES